ncbi:VOC family protein [Nonomuraea africana]|uniref:Catechol 2,3-dioxygenase-like lactoylglutathione lyase family enzyme n=1 Tax=Nonomuraea africana TaxID=46171 RepID=A0ABR9KC26_9ACTN|nr:VOC family protein [Nonomuraea africana]MBE1559554.1 catechol 2,3-dioxygenase-like lactoylglutathione lyase family enzyme [Nonomuraea africana]
MGHDISGLHHVGHVVRDMERALERYRRLGFTLPPPAYPAISAAEGTPAEPFGAGNTHAYFPRDFIELVTVVDDASGRIPADAHLIPLEVPADRLPAVVAAVRGTAANLAACLRRFEGMHILMFDSPDVEGAAARLHAGGVGHGGVHAVQRPVETREGTRLEPVRYLEIDGDDPATARGRVPEGRIGLAESPSAEVIDAQRRADHPNGAIGLVECVLCVTDGELAGVERRYESYLGRQATGSAVKRVFDLGDAKVVLVTASALADLLPGERPPALTDEPRPGERTSASGEPLPGERALASPAFVAYGVAVRDLAATERFLRESGLPVERSAEGDLFVPAAAALGVAIVFHQYTSGGS